MSVLTNCGHSFSQSAMPEDLSWKSEGRRERDAGARYTDLLKTHFDMSNCWIEHVQTQSIHFRNCGWVALNETAACGVRNEGSGGRPFIAMKGRNSAAEDYAVVP